VSALLVGLHWVVLCIALPKDQHGPILSVRQVLAQTACLCMCDKRAGLVVMVTVKVLLFMFGAWLVSLPDCARQKLPTPGTCKECCGLCYLAAIPWQIIASPP
jgi:hypothetical protein